jgi:hypothetical protein
MTFPRAIDTIVREAPRFRTALLLSWAYLLCQYPPRDIKLQKSPRLRRCMQPNSNSIFKLILIRFFP